MDVGPSPLGLIPSSLQHHTVAGPTNPHQHCESPVPLPVRNLSSMGVQKTIITPGNGPRPTRGQKVTIEYTGYLKDETQPDNKGTV